MPPTTSRERLRQRRAQTGGGGFQSLLQTPQADALLAQVQQSIGDLESPLGAFNRVLGGGPSPEKLAEIAEQQRQVEQTRVEETATQQAKDFAVAQGIPLSALGVPGRPDAPTAGAAIAREFATGTDTGARAALVAQTPRGQKALQLAALQQQQAAIDATGGNFGTGLTFAQFDELKSAVGGLVTGSSTLRGIADLVENTTPAQLELMRQGGALGELKADIFSLFRPLQSLLEDKASVLRESDREAIEEFIGSPDSFFAGISTRDAVIIGKMNRIADILDRRTEVKLEGLDERTLSLMQNTLTGRPRPFMTPTGQERAPVGDPIPSPQDIAGQEAAGFPFIPPGIF